jgi:hypothetical protein
MSATHYRTALAATQLRPRLWKRLREVLAPFGCTLDVESLPDYLKRDLGLMGGRVAPPRDPLRD